MSLASVLLPLFIEVVLTFALMLWMGWLRNADFQLGTVRPQDVALRESIWPTRTAQAANSYSNQFELPVLFYVLTILAWDTRHAGVLFVALAWIFVIFRVAQAYVHVTSNIYRLRSAFFSISALVLLIMWAIYIVQVLSGT
jgi:hypothetical protein